MYISMIHYPADEHDPCSSFDVKRFQIDYLHVLRLYISRYVHRVSRIADCSHDKKDLLDEFVVGKLRELVLRNHAVNGRIAPRQATAYFSVLNDRI